MIAILGATGNIGRPLVAQLAKEGHPVRIVTRDAAKPVPAGVEKVVGELDAKTLATLMKGADKLFMLVTPAAPVETEGLALAAAKAAGVKHVVKLSTIGAGGEKPQGLGVHHLEREQAIEASGLKWTHLRPGFFMSNVLVWMPMIQSAGSVRNMYGEGRFYPIAPEDIAAVAAVALTKDGHEGKRYELTGDELITVPQQVETMARVLGRTITCVDISPDEGVKDMRARNAPERVIEPLKGLWLAVRANKVDTHTDTARTVLGRPTMTFEAWCRANLR